MSTNANNGAPDAAPLQFEIAEPAGPGNDAPTCTNCSKEIRGSYHEANGEVVCGACRASLEQAMRGGSGLGRFGRALGFGLVAAAAGSALYYAILATTGYEIGLVAIVVGFAVGRGVSLGARGRGGWKYQSLAMALTYSAIVVTYIPFIIEGLRDMPQPGLAADSTAAVPAGPATTLALGADSATVPASSGELTAKELAELDSLAAAAGGVRLSGLLLATAALFVLAATYPILAGVDNIIGLVIIGIALYQAWKMNRRVTLAFTGPYKVGQPRPAAAGE